MTGELERRHGLMSAVASTMGQADGSAWAVWQIFTDAGSASAYLTTLSVPNEYEDIGMTASQRGSWPCCPCRSSPATGTAPAAPC
ncbi:hypothetical protein [Candidatus Methanomethylophilus sp. 1R26]|uniref:hypothetical protein n=1 Tax=Candidatus Methanomethylophilus sp. 1R26 TaxID=1769296 RepID=UPI0012FEAB24|nr:hypothetical protein [Candidatus Methanomethylophilus sp. 1R26]